MFRQKKAIREPENNLFDKLKTMLDVLQKWAVPFANGLSAEATSNHTSLRTVMPWPKLNLIPA